MLDATCSIFPFKGWCIEDTFVEDKEFLSRMNMDQLMWGQNMWGQNLSEFHTLGWMIPQQDLVWDDESSGLPSLSRQKITLGLSDFSLKKLDASEGLAEIIDQTESLIRLRAASKPKTESQDPSLWGCLVQGISWSSGVFMEDGLPLKEL